MPLPASAATSFTAFGCFRFWWSGFYTRCFRVTFVPAWVSQMRAWCGRPWHARLPLRGLQHLQHLQHLLRAAPLVQIAHDFHSCSIWHGRVFYQESLLPGAALRLEPACIPSTWLPPRCCCDATGLALPHRFGSSFGSSTAASLLQPQRASRGLRSLFTCRLGCWHPGSQNRSQLRFALRLQLAFSVAGCGQAQAVLLQGVHWLRVTKGFRR